MVMPIEAPLPEFTSYTRTIPPVLHYHRKVNLLEWGSTIVANSVLYYNKVKQIGSTYL